MDYVFICVSVLLWLIRPQDWISVISGMGLMTYAMFGSIVGLWLREGGVKLRQFFLSPADAFMAAYLVWIVWVTGDYLNTAKALVPYAGFYFVTALALRDVRKMEWFFNCWAIGYGVVGLLAVSTLWGAEIVAGSQRITDSFGGRLCLNTWIFNNPNALGHGMASALTFLYLWLVWRRGALLKLLGLCCLCLILTVLYETQSKGGYLAAAGAAFCMFLYGKRRAVQLFSIAAMATVGLGALRLLPRMDSLTASEEGILGRFAIWQMAYATMEETVTGQGWRKFEAWIMTPDSGLIRKATHGSYVNVGADLGYGGLLIFIGLLYASLRTTIQVRLHEDDLRTERIRRALMALMGAYAISAWIVDRAYHMDIFMLAGAAAAFHRMLTVKKEKPDESAIADFRPPPVDGQRREVIEEDIGLAYAELQELPPEELPVELRESAPLGLPWRKIRVADLVWIGLLCMLAIEIWTRFMRGYLPI